MLHVHSKFLVMTHLYKPSRFTVDFECGPCFTVDFECDTVLYGRF